MKNIILIIIFSFFCQDIYAQIDRCSTDEMVQKELLLHPEKQVVLDQLELFTTTFIDNLNHGRFLDTSYIIPVVVHVIHNYGEERINKNQIQSAIKAMCDDFNKNNVSLRIFLFNPVFQIYSNTSCQSNSS